MADCNTNESADEDWWRILSVFTASIAVGSSDQGTLVSVDRRGTSTVHMLEDRKVLRFETITGRVFVADMPNVKMRVLSEYNLVVCTDDYTIQLFQLDNGIPIFKDSFYTKDGKAIIWKGCNEEKMKIVDATATMTHVVLVLEGGKIGVIHWKDEHLVTPGNTTRVLVQSNRAVKNVRIDNNSHLVAWFAGKVPLMMHLGNMSTMCLVAPLHHPTLPWDGEFDGHAEYNSVNNSDKAATLTEPSIDYGVMGVAGNGCNIVVACQRAVYVINTTSKAVFVIHRSAVSIDINNTVGILTADGHLEVWSTYGRLLASKQVQIPEFRWSHDAISEQRHSTLVVTNNHLHEIAGWI